MKSLILFLILVITPIAQAEVDLTEFDLTPSQTEIIRRFEATGKYTDEFIINFARASHNHNITQARRANRYIPPYTAEELTATIAWARGGAFASYASFAGYRFLGESYRADCPNVGLFRFGQASGTEFIPQDVMREAINQSHALQTLFSKDPEKFREAFYNEAVRWGFHIYLE
jgi:hypothetical protein